MKMTLIALAVFALIAAPASAKLEIGQAAPAFTVVDAAGNTHSLSDFAGKTVVLEWWNHECPFVEKHYDANNMQQLQKEYTGQEVVWLAVNSSAEGKQGHTPGPEATALMASANAAPTAVLLDHDGTIGQAYSARTTPHMYIINGDGELVYQGAIDDRPTANPADIEGSTNYVSAALTQLFAGEDIAVASTKPYGCSVKY
ncbi:MAG: thioredoxin family protein [Acidobacteriota bacterium]